jgi:hypothetical protein
MKTEIPGVGENSLNFKIQSLAPRDFKLIAEIAGIKLNERNHFPIKFPPGPRAIVEFLGLSTKGEKQVET